MYSLSRASPRAAQKSFLCSSCRNQLRRLWQPPQGKDQRSKYAAKVRDAEQEWTQKATEIREGKRPSMLEILESRGFVNTIAGDKKELDDLLTDKRIAAYVGVDPTAPSLHIGNLLPIMALLHMFLQGYTAVTVLGGATARVGDPSLRTKTRDKLDPTVRKANMASMHVQLKRLWQNMEIFAAAKYGYKNSWARVRALVNNNSWLNKLSLLDFLRVLGAGTRVGPMLTRDTVRNKLDSGDGLSFAELSYPLLQGWDWWELLKQRGVQLQIGGADQYGNIITGMDAVSHMTKNHTEDLPAVIKEMKPFGFTVPLLTTSKGEKFGKSAGNAIWLDEAMTSSFDLYQFFLRSADADVGRYLKLFTLLPLPEIENLVQEHQLDPSLRLAQRTLAREVVGMIHGQQACRKVEYESGLLLRAPKEPNTNQRPSRYPTTDVNPEMNKYAPQTNSANAPSHNVLLPRSLVENQPFSRVLYHAGMVSSKGEGHRLIANGGAHVGSKPADKGAMPDALKYTRVLNWTADQTWRFVMDESLLILRVGKWKVKIIKVISDDEFAKKGLDAPGWQESRQSTPEEKIVGVFDKMTRKTTGKS